MIKAVLFDLDGTLFDRDSSVRRLVERQYDAFGAELAPIGKHSFVERFIELDQRGYVPKPQVYRQLVAELETTVSAQQLFGYWQAHFHERCLLYPAARTTLEQLGAAGMLLGIITNGGFPWQLRTVQALGIQRYFRVVLISEAEGLRKPDAAIFGRAVQRLGVRANEAVFVGDHPVVDIAGAHNAGLLTVWKREPFWPAPTEAGATIDGLGELPAALGKL